jgi:hypothetical protein
MPAASCTTVTEARSTPRSAIGVERSVGGVGDSHDNALAQSINGLYKTEVIRRRGPWRNIDAVEYATLVWVDCFNNRGLLEPLGYVPPEAAFINVRRVKSWWPDSTRLGTAGRVFTPAGYSRFDRLAESAPSASATTSRASVAVSGFAAAPSPTT